LTKPYWTSEERWRAWGLLLTIIALNLGNVYISVRINQWNRVFYDALQQFDATAFFHQLAVFCALATLSIAMSVYALYLNQMLQIRWRRWLTQRYVGAWLGERAYFQLQMQYEGTDNPDQRISEDLSLFTGSTLALSLGLLTSVVTLVSFLVILWQLSGPAAIPLGPLGVAHVPGYLVWCALVYAGIGTWLTVKIGRPLVPLNFAQQRFEADFRYSLVRLRENAESIAFYRGESSEAKVFRDRFRHVFENFRKIMKRQKQLTWFTSGYAQIAIVFPVVVIAPRYFARQVQLGGMMQVVSAFSSVQSALSFIISSYTDIASWQAVTQRLSTFDERLRVVHGTARAPQPIAIGEGAPAVSVRGLDLDLPDSTPLLRGVDLDVGKGDAVLLVGPSGVGKSTLLRAIAGLWPFGHGKIYIGEDAVLFVPQRPYIPLGTLADALLYPGTEVKAATTLRAVLDEVGLGRFAAEIDADANWPQRLSLGEQQRLAFARILLTRPNLLFLDEATSALDEAAERHLYALLRRGPWRPTIISVGHSDTLRPLHDAVLDVGDFSARDRSRREEIAVPSPAYQS
jgi:putative ATP-binding cassette transporter